MEEVHNERLSEEKEKKLAEYEETMRIIKEATGVSIVEEVIEKFQNQHDTQKHLIQLQKQNEVRHEAARVKKTRLQNECEALKYSGQSQHANSFRIVENFKNQVTAASLKHHESKSRFERSAKVLTAAKSGLQHLIEKLDGIQCVRMLR